METINIAFIGKVSCGKSTLISSLFGNIIAESSIDKTTIMPQIYTETKNIKSNYEDIYNKSIICNMRHKNNFVNDNIYNFEIAESIILSDNGDDKYSDDMDIDDDIDDKNNNANNVDKYLLKIYDMPGIDDASDGNNNIDIYLKIFYNYMVYFNYIFYIMDAERALIDKTEIYIIENIVNKILEYKNSNDISINKYLAIIINKIDKMETIEKWSDIKNNIINKVTKITSILKDLYVETFFISSMNLLIKTILDNNNLDLNKDRIDIDIIRKILSIYLSKKEFIKIKDNKTDMIKKIHEINDEIENVDSNIKFINYLKQLKINGQQIVNENLFLKIRSLDMSKLESYDFLLKNVDIINRSEKLNLEAYEQFHIGLHHTWYIFLINHNEIRNNAYNIFKQLREKLKIVNKIYTINPFINFKYEKKYIDTSCSHITKFDLKTLIESLNDYKINVKYISDLKIYTNYKYFISLICPYFGLDNLDGQNNSYNVANNIIYSKNNIINLVSNKETFYNNYFRYQVCKYNNDFKIYIEKNYLTNIGLNLIDLLDIETYKCHYYVCNIIIKNYIMENENIVKNYFVKELMFFNMFNHKYLRPNIYDNLYGYMGILNYNFENINIITKNIMGVIIYGFSKIF